MSRFYYDFHIHSCLSPCGDNDMTPNNIVHMAKLCGLDMIALTDHNSCKNCEAAVQVGNAIGLCVIPGMELCTQEEAHVICLFPDVASAQAFGMYVESKSMKIKNNARIFGDQIIMNRADIEIGREENLLITASGISVNRVSFLVREYGGAAYPAHIDKDSYSVLSALGEIPPEADFHAAEITDRGDVEMLKKKHPCLEKMLLLLDSDAHLLDTMTEKRAWIDLPEKSAPCLIDAINGKIAVKWER